MTSDDVTKALRQLRSEIGTREVARRLGVPEPSLRRMVNTGKPSLPVLKLFGVERMNIKGYVGRMIAAMTAYRGDPKQRHHYNAYRDAKRELYRLYYKEPHKAKALCRFALAQAGWVEER